MKCTTPGNAGMKRSMSKLQLPAETGEFLRRRLAANVRARRKEMGLTQKSASQRASICVRLWQKLEAAELNATLQTLAHVSVSLMTDPMELLADA